MHKNIAPDIINRLATRSPQTYKWLQTLDQFNIKIQPYQIDLLESIERSDNISPEAIVISLNDRTEGKRYIALTMLFLQLLEHGEIVFDYTVPMEMRERFADFCIDKIECTIHPKKIVLQNTFPKEEE